MNAIPSSINKSFIRCILDAMPNPVFIKNERHQWIACNHAFCRLMGKAQEELLFKSDFDILPEEQARIFWEKDDEVFATDETNYNEEQITDGNGNIRWLLTTKATFAYNDSRYLVGVITDITEQKRNEASTRTMAFEDALTGLPNRRLLKEHLHLAQAAARRHRRSLALMIIDLDDFKHINDTLGHSAGDQLLINIAQRLRGTVRESDIVARLGGDEFAVLATGESQLEFFGHLAERLITRVREPMTIGDVTVRNSASVGVTVSFDDSVDTDDLFAQADLALYASKAKGKNTWSFFESTMQERARTLVQLQQDLDHALKREEFVLYYQPIFDVKNARLITYEALLRWNNPHKGLLTPSEFLEAAERNRLFVPLTLWTITQALRQAGEWRKAGEDTAVAVNLATSVFEADGLVEHIDTCLKLNELSPGTLIIEVTEGAMIDRGKAVSVLERLRALGVQVAIDDFGAGHSSLGRLDQIPVDVLKIDRMFVANTSRRRQAILRATIELAHHLGLRTVVEGIETPAQYALACRYGADAVQGFYFAEPMPAQELLSWHRSRANVLTLSSQLCIGT